jgi:hypothetical protein
MAWIDFVEVNTKRVITLNTKHIVAVFTPSGRERWADIHTTTSPGNPSGFVVEEPANEVATRIRLAEAEEKNGR